MSHFSNLVEHLSFRKVGERVALLLLENTEKDGDLVRLTQADLAAEVGTTREVVAALRGYFADGRRRAPGGARITVVKTSRQTEQQTRLICGGRVDGTWPDMMRFSRGGALAEAGERRLCVCVLETCRVGYNPR